jgi:hypothetical protein
MDHGFQSHVHFTAANDLSHVRRVIGLQQGNVDAFILEITLGLGKVDRGMVRGCVPWEYQQCFKGFRLFDHKT